MPKQASLKKNEGYVYNNLLDKRKKVKPKFQVNHFVRVADLRKTFPKGDTTNWSSKLYNITEIHKDALTSYHLDKLQERYNESLVKTTKLQRKKKTVL